MFVNPTNVPATGTASGTIEHQRKLGETVYNSSDLSIQMQTIFQTTGSVYKGARYRIAYNFKAGYSYMIYVTAAAVENTVGFNTGPYIRLDVNNNGGGGSTGCNGPENLNPNTGGNPAAVKLSSNSFQEFQFVLPALGTQPTLEVTAFPAENGGTKTVRIRKIRIVETPPPATFTITPNPIPIVCGKTNPVTLTINNVNNTSGVTGYTWNLGTGNTWIYNGSPAPASIATTTNTLTLSPTCGITLGSVSATVSVGTLNYPTNTATVSSTNETLSISGLDPLCSGSAVYSVANLPPCGATVTVWAASPSGIVSVTNNGNNTATISKLADGQVTITATVNSTCTGNTTVTFPLLVGGSYGDDFTINSSTYAGCYGLFEMLDLQAFPKYTTKNYSVSYEWSYLKESTTEPTVWTSLPCNYSSCTVSFYEEGTYQLRLITTDDCGKQNTTIKNITISESCNGSGYFRLSASPNPASNDLYVTIDNESEELKKNTKGLLNVQLNLYDLNTGQMIQQWKKSNNQKQYLLSVGGIKRGQYILQVVKGKYKASKIILIN